MNLILSDKLLTFINGSSNPSLFMMTKMSSTYLNHIVGGRGYFEIALVSNECINKLVTIGETCNPIASPVCLHKSRELKNVEYKHRSRALVISEGPNLHCCLS